MRSHGDLTGLIKFLARDEWKAIFEEVLSEHFGPANQEFDLTHEAIAAALGGGWDMTLWGVAFEDFLGRQFADRRNFVDEYLKHRGWRESAPAKTYMRGLRNSVMSLYEASAIVPGRSFLVRDLVRGGEPVLISERTATRTLKDWDRIAARVVAQREKRVLAGGLLPFSFDASERLIAKLKAANSRSQRAKVMAPSDNGALTADDNLRALAPLFSVTWLADVLPATLGNSRTTTLYNSEGDEVVFHEVRFPLAAKVTVNELSESLSAIGSLRRENEVFWNWVDEPAPSRLSPSNDDAENALAWNVTMEDGSTVLGAIEITDRALIVNVNSATRAKRAIAMLREAAGELLMAPLTQIQTVDQMMAQERGGPRATSEIPPEIQTEVVHATLDKQYRAVLDQPVPMLGNVTPRAAARTKSGREKVAVWLKHIENHSRQRKATDPMATYDFTWMWRELKVEDLRR